MKRPVDGRVRVLARLAVACCFAFGAAGAATVKFRPQGTELLRAVQRAVAALSTKELPVTLDDTAGVMLVVGGSGASAAPFNPDVAARVVTVNGERRIEFNPRGPLTLDEAVRLELARELGMNEWTPAAARMRLSGADVNADGRIDLADLAIIMSNYGKTSSVGDLNQDRRVDDEDIRLFTEQYRP